MGKLWVNSSDRLPERSGLYLTAKMYTYFDGRVDFRYSVMIYFPNFGFFEFPHNLDCSIRLTPEFWMEISNPLY